MKKNLLIILIVILLTAGYFAIFKGMNVFGIKILSITQLKEKNEKLGQDLQNVSTLTSVNQPKAMSELTENAKKLTIAKEEYSDKILYSSSENIAAASQGIQYEMEYLWTKVGNHATKNGINLRFELKSSTSGETGKYDLNFTTTGRYASISEFIASIENDSSLNFKIEDFKLIPTTSSTQILQATFKVKDISVKIDNTITKTPNTTNTDTNTTGNTTNTTTNNTVTNTTNSVQ